MDREALSASKAYFNSIYGYPEVQEAFNKGAAQAGYRGALRSAAEVFEAGFPKAYVNPSDVAYLHVGAGDNPRALDWLEKGCDVRDPNMPYVGMPWFDPLRSEPRYQAILRRMNLPQ